MVRVAIAGITGYSGEELLRLLLQHPQVEVTYVAGSQRFERPEPVTALYPDLAAASHLACEALDATRAAQRSDLCFLALPHGQAMHVVPALLQANMRVIDLSGDFRLRDARAYDQWYGFPHANPALLNEAVYGLPEYFRDAIRPARLVANPGCYATSTLLGMLPLVRAQLCEGTFIVDATSGCSGAGRQAADEFLGQDNMRVYKALDTHQHVPEMLQAVKELCDVAIDMVFTPHVVSIERGLISSVYARVRAGYDTGMISRVLHEAYDQEPLVDVRDDGWAAFTDVQRLNTCVMGTRVAKGIAVVVSALDNLRKGAASQAIQNMNLMCGWEETMGLGA